MQNESQKQKKKIIYIITKSNFGGAQRYVYDMATNLPKSEYDVSVALGGNGQLVTKLRNKKIPIINIDKLARDVSFLNDIAVLFYLIKLFRKEKPDIVHLNSSKIGGLGAFAARLARVPNIIFTAHGWAFNELWRSQIARGLIWTLSFVTSLFSHHIITVSQKDYKQGMAMPFVGNKISNIYLGIVKERFVNKETAREKILGDIPINTPKEVLWIGSIAELTENKGLTYAIKSIHKIVTEKTQAQSIIYVVIGSGENKNKLQTQINELGLENIVFLIGNKENASTLLKAMDIFILPSIKEGLPYTLLEAGLAGLPVITTDVGGIPEIIEDMETGILIRPKDAEELSKTISFLISQKKKQRVFGKRLKEKIETTFSLEKMLDKTIILYRS